VLTPYVSVMCLVRRPVHTVRCRPDTHRRIRVPPRRMRRGERRPNTGKPMRGLKRSARRLAAPPADEEETF